MQDADGQPISLGSGFFVEKDIVATNFHVIGEAAGGYVDGEPIDTRSIDYQGIIPAGLAKRLEGRVDPDVEMLHCPNCGSPDPESNWVP